ncbi:hypothetical protein JTB14_037157 [Gonioctena quinquepunctata]|nr:hypothetical protein JTB14_037157 [Gonioctena quinquepunctata]
MAGVSHGIQPRHRGIATARPYQSSFTLFVKFLQMCWENSSPAQIRILQTIFHWGIYTFRLVADELLIKPDKRSGQSTVP